MRRKMPNYEFHLVNKLIVLPGRFVICVVNTHKYSTQTTSVSLGGGRIPLYLTGVANVFNRLTVFLAGKPMKGNKRLC